VHLTQPREIVGHTGVAGGNDKRAGLGGGASGDAERFSILLGSSWRWQRLEPGPDRSLAAQEVSRLIWQALAAWAAKAAGKK
jgi:hypothetical protein